MHARLRAQGVCAIAAVGKPSEILEQLRRDLWAAGSSDGNRLGPLQPSLAKRPRRPYKSNRKVMPVLPRVFCEDIALNPEMLENHLSIHSSALVCQNRRAGTVLAAITTTRQNGR